MAFLPRLRAYIVLAADQPKGLGQLFHDGQNKRSSALSKLGDRKRNILELDKLSFNEMCHQ